MDELRDGKREGSVLSTDTIDSLCSDQREAWRLVRKELEDIGITPQLFEQHQVWITKTLQEAFEAGALQEAPSTNDVDIEVEVSIANLKVETSARADGPNASPSLPQPQT